MNSRWVPSETDVFVIGGGPAGLAAALAARRCGLEVMVADRACPVVNKVCAEGLMPDGVAAIRGLGVELGPEHGAPIRGIRFLENGLEVEAAFPNNNVGLGVRRTLLHRLLMQHAEDAGVVTRWQSKVEALDTSTVKVDGRTVRCRWIIGADGFHSRVRRWTGLLPVWTGPRRIGFRQHFRIRPWTDFVEVYWRDHCQAYVTPVGSDEVCVALIGSARDARLSDLPTLFPALAKRLCGARPTDAPRGAISMSVKLSGVTQGRVALVGDASGSVDAITGEGLALAFRQANCLATCLAADDLPAYKSFHHQVGRRPLFMARLMLLIDGSYGLRRGALHTLAVRPRIFDHLLAFHLGALRHSDSSREFQNVPLRHPPVTEGVHPGR